MLFAGSKAVSHYPIFVEPSGGDIPIRVSCFKLSEKREQKDSWGTSGRMLNYLVQNCVQKITTDPCENFTAMFFHKNTIR